MEQKMSLKYKIELFGHFILLFIMTGAIIPLMNNNSLVRVINYSLMFIYYIMLIYVIGHILKYRLILNKFVKLTVLLNILCLFSILWSSDRNITLYYSFFICGTTIYALYLSMRVSKENILKILIWVLFVCAVLSIICSIFFPKYGIQVFWQNSFEIDTSANSWKGVFSHKNTLGRVMSLGILCSVFGLKNDSKFYKILSLATLILSSVALIFSRSDTSILIIIILMIILAWFKISNKTRISRYLIYIVILFVVLLINQDKINSFLINSIHKDFTLSGRTVIWQLCIEKIKVKPFLGYGYNAFWLGLDGPSASIIYWLNTDVVTAHNGVIDLALQIGLIGTFIFVITILLFLKDNSKIIYNTTKFIDLFPLIYIIFIFFNNFTESIILYPNSIFWILQVLCFSLYKIEYNKMPINDLK